MKSTDLSMRRTIFTLLIFTLVFASVSIGSTQAAPTNAAVVYYVSNGDLYSVKTDGSHSVKVRENFKGVEIKPAGNYMYYMDEETAELFRFSLSDTAALSEDFDGDVQTVDYVTVGDMIYFMSVKGGIYSVSANAKNTSEAKLIVKSKDSITPNFAVAGGRIYYNTFREGYEPWVVSKSVDGSGPIKWIAAGGFDHSDFVRATPTTLSIMVNTKPFETEYSLNCMVLYTMPINGGPVKAANPKNPLDTNAVYSGSWTNDYYLYNKGILLDSDGDYDYTKGKAFLLQKDGKSIQLHKTSVFEVVDFGAKKLAFVDGSGKTSVSTIANSKVTSTKAVALSDVDYISNLFNDKVVKTTMLFGESGAYTLNADLSIKKIVGVEADSFRYEKNIDGIFFVNTGDNSRLYRMSEDGQTSVKLADEKVSSIVLITKP
ncbi:hypothetical protein PMSD_10830 [Paenibacillus macquariensis subsp. defensor]|nr:hypothetical protein PMSD_10830 [Paenibacillus macquariensis subsp. defensor]